MTSTRGHRGRGAVHIPGKCCEQRRWHRSIHQKQDRKSHSSVSDLEASQVISVKTKLRIFNTNVKSVLLYACETWRITKALTHTVQTVINICCILHIKWQDKITYEKIWRRTGQAQAEAQIKRRKWDWLGHTLRNPMSSVVRHALKWNPQGKRKRRRTRSTWRRSVETEGRTLGHSWGQLEVLSRDRAKWRKLVADLCSTRSTRV